MRTLSKPLPWLAAGCLSLLSLCLTPTASAGPVTMNITNANCGLNCSTVPPNSVLGSVTMNLNSNGSVTVTIVLNPAYTFIVPDGNDINFNLGNSTASNVSVSNFLQSQSSGGPFNIPLTYSSINGNTNVGGGLGNFAVTLFHLQDPSKPQQPLDYLTFTITNTLGCTTTNSAGCYTMQDLLNSSWAFHLGNCPSPNNGCNATTTGFVAAGPLTTVPELGTAPLAVFGTGLLFVGSFLRRRIGKLTSV